MKYRQESFYIAFLTVGLVLGIIVSHAGYPKSWQILKTAFETCGL